MRASPLTLLAGSLLLVAITDAAQAKKSADDFSRLGHGCWDYIPRDGNFLRFCFQGDEIVQGEASNYTCGFTARGVFRAGLRNIVILGFPGNGWPAKNTVEDCGYHFEENGRVLVLDGCSVAGIWKKSDDSPVPN